MSKDLISFLKIAGLFAGAILVLWWLITIPMPPDTREVVKLIIYGLFGACGIKIAMPGPPQVDHEELAKKVVALQEKKKEPSEPTV